MDARRSKPPPCMAASARSPARGPATGPPAAGASGPRRPSLRVALLPLGEDAIAVLRRPVEIVGIDDLADVLGETLGHRKARHAHSGEVLGVEPHGLVADGPVEELLGGRVLRALLGQRV